MSGGHLFVDVPAEEAQGGHDSGLVDAAPLSPALRSPAPPAPPTLKPRNMRNRFSNSLELINRSLLRGNKIRLAVKLLFVTHALITIGLGGYYAFATGRSRLDGQRRAGGVVGFLAFGLLLFALLDYLTRISDALRTGVQAANSKILDDVRSLAPSRFASLTRVGAGVPARPPRSDGVPRAAKGAAQQSGGEENARGVAQSAQPAPEQRPAGHPALPWAGGFDAAGPERPVAVHGGLWRKCVRENQC